jgi:glycosyltransferase involved in cell wall biosynthesis
MPQYAARLIRGALNALDENCDVLGSLPSVPVAGMERVLGKPISWVDASKPIRWSDCGLQVPRIFVQSGWSYPAFCALGLEVKRRGGRVIGLSDANWRGDFRQVVLGVVAFHCRYRKHFDAVIVPGRQGERLMKWFGMPADRIRIGMYGADPELFESGPPLQERPKRFLYVGQFIKRKDVLRLCRAFLRFAAVEPDWVLRLCGGGEQRGLIPQHPRIEVDDFVQPEELGKIYRQARFFVLPSLVEAWGLVVHEAALSGCGLIVSNRVGSAEDLCNNSNAISFRARNEDDLVRALHEAAAFGEARLEKVLAESRRLAASFGPERFGREVARLVRALQS